MTLVVDAFVETAEEHAMTIVVYCVMPDHMHLLVDGDHDASDLRAFMKLAKQRALRKHIVESVLDYPYWGSMRWTREELLRSIGLRRT